MAAVTSSPDGTQHHVIRIEGGRRLRGTVYAAGAKNAALPALAAALLSSEPVTVQRVPDLDDVHTLVCLLEHLGARVRRPRPGVVTVDPPDRPVPWAPEELVRRMRASFLVLGPLVARWGEARIPLPGGCAIGNRPVDLHLHGLAALGARVEQRGSEVCVRAHRLRGATIYLDVPSVTATENLLMAAVLARGRTVIENAAREPEVVDLADLLRAMGARIRGAGSGRIEVEGVAELGGCRHRLIPDRIEAGTYLLAGAITAGTVTVAAVRPEHMAALLAKLQAAGADLEVGEDHVTVRARGRPGPLDVRTLPYPGFPTDLQAPLTALLTVATGTSTVTETVFEHRFGHVPELVRMGARIRVQGATAVIEGVAGLVGARVEATDLRAGAALVLAGLAAEGVTEVAGVHHIDRGYEQLVERLAALGARVERRPAPADARRAGADARATALPS